MTQVDWYGNEHLLCRLHCSYINWAMPTWASLLSCWHKLLTISNSVQAYKVYLNHLSPAQLSLGLSHCVCFPCCTHLWRSLRSQASLSGYACTCSWYTSIIIIIMGPGWRIISLNKRQAYWRGKFGEWFFQDGGYLSLMLADCLQHCMISPLDPLPNRENHLSGLRVKALPSKENVVRKIWRMCDNKDLHTTRDDSDSSGSDDN